MPECVPLPSSQTMHGLYFTHCTITVTLHRLETHLRRVTHHNKHIHNCFYFLYKGFRLLYGNWRLESQLLNAILFTICATTPQEQAR